MSPFMKTIDDLGRWIYDLPEGGIFLLTIPIALALCAPIFTGITLRGVPKWKSPPPSVDRFDYVLYRVLLSRPLTVVVALSVITLGLIFLAFGLAHFTLWSEYEKVTSSWDDPQGALSFALMGGPFGVAGACGWVIWLLPRTIASARTLERQARA